MKELLWYVAMIGAGIGSLTFILGLFLTHGAPQQTAVSIKAIAFALIPYLLYLLVS